MGGMLEEGVIVGLLQIYDGRLSLSYRIARVRLVNVT